jgi:hypothetical protein
VCRCFGIYEASKAILAFNGGHVAPVGITIGIWIAIMGFLVFAFVVAPAVLFREETRRADARRVLQQILDFVRPPRSRYLHVSVISRPSGHVERT